MVVVPWPNPIPGQPDQVVVDDMPMELVPGKYSVEEADRFGEKVSQGTLKYSDFNPFENAWAVAELTGGAGLRRYSDAPGDPDTYRTLYTESNNVNCAFAPVVLSPQITLNALPGATSPAVWIGEDWRSSNLNAPKRLVCVAAMGANTGVFERTGSGPWNLWVTITGKTNPLGPACGTYGGSIIVGFGGAYTASVVNPAGAITDVMQDTAAPGGKVPIFVWAYTSDRASNYIAGGPAATDFYKIMSSIAVGDLYATPVNTGDTMINALAPGGGLVLVYVGKMDALGCVDNQAIYHDLVPFDTRMVTNCNPTKWLLASGSDQARGSLSLVFPRERSLWEYQPADQYSGTASCIAPWASNFRRPPNARGIVTAIVGGSRWLYYAVQNTAGQTWIWRNDQSTGAPHTYLYLGTVTVRAMAITHIFAGNPVLVFSHNTSMATAILPRDGDAEFDDPACRYASQGYVDLPDVDLGFPDEDKIGFAVRVISDNLVGLNRYHRIEASLDGGAFITLGDVIESPSGEVQFPLSTNAKRIKLRVWFFTDDPTNSPRLWGVSLRVSLNTRVYRLFVFQTRLPAGSYTTLADDLQNPYLQILHSWAIRKSGAPVPFLDPWSDEYQVRVLKLQQQQALREPDRTPEWVMDWTMLEFLEAVPKTGDFVYDMPWTTDPDAYPTFADLWGYDEPLALYDSQDPFY